MDVDDRAEAHEPCSIHCGRFLSRFALQPNGCWKWTLALNGEGYGHMTVDKRQNVRAHRWFYDHFVGPIPPGHVVRHRCDNRWCVRPSHLVAGTPAQNSQDMVDRQRSARGVDHPNSILTPGAVRGIRARLADGASTPEIGREFGVSRCAVWSIAVGRTWAWLDAPVTPPEDDGAISERSTR